MDLIKRKFIPFLARCMGVAAIATTGLLLAVPPAFAAVCDGSASDPDTCTGRTTGNGNVCMGDLSGFGTGINCTANDVSIGFADNIRDAAGNPITSCTQGGTVTGTGDFHVQTSGGVTRFDLGLYFAIDGDPNHDGAKSGGCQVSKVSGPSPTNNVSGNFLQLDAAPPDSCGDIDASHKPQTVRIAFSTPCQPSPLFFNPATGKCQATDPGSGQFCVLLPNGVSWRQTGANDTCDSPLDAFPGTTSKCNVNPTFGIPVVVEQANVVVVKTANPTSVPETGGTVTYTVTATNSASFNSLTITSISDDVYGDLTDSNNPKVSNNTCADTADPPDHLHVGKVLGAGGFASCTFDAFDKGNQGTSLTDTAEVCGNLDNDGSGCGNDPATVTFTNVDTPPSLDKQVQAYTMDVTYKVQVTNNSTVDTLTVNALNDDKFGDITAAHAAGGGFEAVVSSNCNALVGTVIPVSGPGGGNNPSCTFVGQITNTSANPHTNTATATTTDSDGDEHTPADNATVSISITQ